ncbi:MAG: Hpt domain-containing protein, partial [Gammaproteobacteria bacterium]
MLLDDEILDEFLHETQGVLNHLEDRLVALERAPFDGALLNTVLCDFHTVKGGAGFLGLDPMVKLAHQSEDALDALRAHQRRLTPAVTDIFLRVSQHLRKMLGSLRSRGVAAPAAPELSDALWEIACSAAHAESDLDETAEFDAVVAKMLQAAPGSTSELAPGSAISSALPHTPDLITDNELDALLDTLTPANAERLT